MNCQIVMVNMLMVLSNVIATSIVLTLKLNGKYCYRKIVLALKTKSDFRDVCLWLMRVKVLSYFHINCIAYGEEERDVHGM